MVSIGANHWQPTAVKTKSAIMATPHNIKGCVLRECLIIANPWVQPGVGQVRQKVSGERQESRDDANAHEQRIVMGKDRFQPQLSHTGPGKKGFDDKTAADERRQG